MADKPNWANPNWLRSVSAWIKSCFARDGVRMTGALEQIHLRPWSTVFKVPTNKEPFYFKATSPSLVHEASVTQALFTWQPESIHEVHSADPDRGWMLMPNGGQPLREFIKSVQEIQHWEALLSIYAELQQMLSEKTQSLLSLGTPDRRLETLSSKFEELLDDKEALQLGHSKGLSSGELASLRNFPPRLTELCNQLIDAGVPQSLHHGDLHDGNIFFHDGNYKFFDWGDCSLTHPFFSMRTAFVSLENTLKIEENSAWHERLMHAYLEPWTNLGTYLELVDVFRIAHNVSPLCSALSWRRSLSDLNAEDREPYAEAIPSLLRELLELNQTD